MVLLGTIVNGLCIILGTLVGLFFSKIPERYKETVLNGIALSVVLIGLQMAFQTENVIVVLLSILTGAIIGEWMELDDKLNRFGQWIEDKFKTNHPSTNTIAEGFVTATLIFVIGAMAVIGALDSGLRGDHEVLITKSILDGFMSLVLTTTLGIGVVLSVIPVVLYEGGITLLATKIEQLVPEWLFNGVITEMTATGGLLIVVIGLNLLNVTKIRIANLLPSLVTVTCIVYIYQLIN